MATYDEIMQAARNAEAAGALEDAQRLRDMANRVGNPQAEQSSPDALARAAAEKRRAQLQAIQRAQLAASGLGQSDTTMSGQGFFANPYNGQMTSRELLANMIRPNAAESLVGGTERGAFYAGNDEASGAVAAAIPGPGSMGERARFATERSRAEHEANMRDNPIATTVGEIIGGVATGGRAIDAARRGVGKLAPSVANLANRNFATRAVTGGVVGGADAGAYGFMSGEDGNRYDTALDASKWGAGLGAAGSLGADAITSYLASRSTRQATDRMVANTPSSDKLREDAGFLFDEAVRTGGTANQAQTAQLATNFRDILTREGLIGPDGKMVTSYPKVSDAFRQIEAYGRQSMSPAQMRTVRRLLQNAAQSSDRAESRMGSILLDQFDNFSTEFMPQIPQANDLYTKASRGDMIEEAINLASNKAGGTYSGAGFENALRTEFRRLNRDVIKGRLKGLSPDQVAMIDKIAKGGPIENVMRDVGRMAPTSVWNATMTGGAPVALGTMLGSPGVGIALGAGALGAGAMGRRIASNMQGRNAAIASALMRGGELPRQSVTNPATRRIIEDMLRKNVNAAVTQ
ncbi:MAG: hypothetical protein HOY44_10100 [Maritimibacter sp.]|uniref:hypothetical protein n=1 Tax=Maritimibacter sp. TaxID=2003363 RepID=UPI001E070768|nr:hypothetical protein [Maritimibacter sp.]MBL6427865.1 hypothetical protein [Maritimibacter sp.]